MSSNGTSGDLRLDLEIAFRATPEDVRAFRALRAQASSWLGLSHDDLEALLPAGALDRRSVRPDRTPFTLEFASKE